MTIFLLENIQIAEVIVGWKLDKKLICAIIYQYKNSSIIGFSWPGEPYFYCQNEGVYVREKGESSITSLVSAFGRAYHSEFDSPKIFDDYVAKEFISPKERSDIETNMVQGIHFSIQTLQSSFKTIRKKY